MEETSTYRAVRIDDTADWRLIVYISRTGMSAYLKNEEDPTEPVITLFSRVWERDDDTLLRNIETTVYDNPQLLDDFSTEIVIISDRALWAPRHAVEESEGEEELYNRVYKAEEEDIFIDEYDDKMCMYTLTEGLQPFIRRTLPGARTWCQQTLEVSRYIDRFADMPRLYVDIRDGEADYVGFDGRKLLIATTHPWRDKMEIAYQIFNIMDIYGLDPEECQVSLSGKREIKSELMQLLREHIRFVMLTMLPGAAAKGELPPAVGLLLSRLKKTT